MQAFSFNLDVTDCHLLDRRMAGIPDKGRSWGLMEAPERCP